MDHQDKLLAKARHYRKLARQVTDQRLVDVLEELASEYEQAAQQQREGGAAPEHGRAPGSHKG